MLGSCTSPARSRTGILRAISVGRRFNRAHLCITTSCTAGRTASARARRACRRFDRSICAVSAPRPARPTPPHCSTSLKWQHASAIWPAGRHSPCAVDVSVVSTSSRKPSRAPPSSVDPRTARAVARIARNEAARIVGRDQRARRDDAERVRSFGSRAARRADVSRGMQGQNASKCS